ncbi:hypothetical protein GALL_452770 [mine drainage metagenome]|uniref:Uncharacterized protein n=1 Tax=mine drainage metagenome TaxID=410659 RepID=A0A1J5PNL1_9ZZZZ
MWNAFINRHFQHFGVNHQQPHIVRFGLVQQAQNHGVDTDRLARTRGAGHQHVRHLGQVGQHRVANNVLAQAHGQHGFGFVVNFGAQNFGQLDGLPLGVGQFQRHGGFARNGLHHTDRYQTQTARQILGQANDLRAFDPGGRLNFIAGNDRARLCQHHVDLDTKVLESFLDHAAGHLQRLGINRFLARLRRIKQINLRQLAVKNILEQRFLPLFGHPRALGQVSDHRLHHHHRFGRMDRRVLLPLIDQHVLAFLRRLLPQDSIFLPLHFFAPALNPGKQPGTHALCQLHPGKIKNQC